MHKLKHSTLSRNVVGVEERRKKKQMICEFHFSMPRQVTILIHQLHLWLKPLRAKNSWDISLCSYLCCTALCLAMDCMLFFSFVRIISFIMFLFRAEKNRNLLESRAFMKLFDLQNESTGTWTMLLRRCGNKSFSGSIEIFATTADKQVSSIEIGYKQTRQRQEIGFWRFIVDWLIKILLNS